MNPDVTESVSVKVCGRNTVFSLCWSSHIYLNMSVWLLFWFLFPPSVAVSLKWVVVFKVLPCCSDSSSCCTASTQTPFRCIDYNCWCNELPEMATKCFIIQINKSLWWHNVKLHFWLVFCRAQWIWSVFSAGRKRWRAARHYIVLVFIVQKKIITNHLCMFWTLASRYNPDSGGLAGDMVSLHDAGKKKKELLH